MLIEQLIDLENVRAENLKLRTVLDLVMALMGGWLFNHTVDDCLQRQILQIENRSLSEPCPVNAGLYMAFKH